MADISAGCGLCEPKTERYRASTLLEQLKHDLPQSRVSLGWLFDYARGQSPEVLILILAVLGVIPGVATPIGFLLVLFALAVLFGRELDQLPSFMAARGFSSSHLVRVIENTVPFFKWSERLACRPDGAVAEALRPFAQVTVLLLSCTLLVPLPFSNVVPSLAIGFIAFATLEGDCFLLPFSLVTGALSLAITSLTIWASVGVAGSLFG